VVVAFVSHASYEGRTVDRSIDRSSRHIAQQQQRTIDSKPLLSSIASSIKLFTFSFDMSSETFLTLCLQSRQDRKVVSMKSSATTEDLYERAKMEFGGASIASLKGGFPPKAIASDASTIISNLLSNQERITVEFAEAATMASSKSANGKGKKVAAAGTTIKKKESTETPSTSASFSPRKSRRAASKAATESMPAMIKAQDEMFKGQQQPSTGKRTKPSGRVVHGTSSRRSKRSQPKAAMIPASAGRRLDDGAVVVADPRARASKARPRSGGNHPTADLSEALMGALHDRGQMGTILRRGMKNAVQASYETSKAFSRLAAVQGKQYVIVQSGGGDSSTSGGGGGGYLTITYHGSVDKQKVEETVDCIPRDVLIAVLEGIHASDKEALRPENLARLSPRVLWSCVYHFPNDGSLDSIYLQLLPDLDWSFLQRRAQQLSEKALENKRQEDEKERRRNGETDVMDMDQAARAVASVEHAMEHLHEYQSEERKARAKEWKICGSLESDYSYRTRPGRAA
jgi:hypothetical protein